VTLDLERGAEFFTHKPPLHFHVQEEYIEATQGLVALEIDGHEVVLSPGPDGRFDIGAHRHHRSYPLPLARQQREGKGETVVRFLLSGGSRDDDPAAALLHPIFFENWYKYQDDIVVNGARVDLIQVFCVSPHHPIPHKPFPRTAPGHLTPPEPATMNYALK
jgi:hypothetical protein